MFVLSASTVVVYWSAPCECYFCFPSVAQVRRSFPIVFLLSSPSLTSRSIVQQVPSGTFIYRQNNTISFQTSLQLQDSALETPTSPSSSSGTSMAQ
jgi:hypothetical protein